MKPKPFPSSPSAASARRRSQGFTLIELMVAVAVVGILAAIAFPSYTRYIVRSRSLAALTSLSSYSISLEQRYQDVGSYGADGVCGINLGAPGGDFSYACTLTDGDPSRFTVVAIGSGLLTGISYSIDDAGVRRTLSHPYGVPASDCWTVRGGTCDS